MGLETRRAMANAVDAAQFAVQRALSYAPPHRGAAEPCIDQLAHGHNSVLPRGDPGHGFVH
jgi:hypothetical protein